MRQLRNVIRPSKPLDSTSKEPLSNAVRGGLTHACAGFNKHSTPLPTARQTLDDISHEHPPTQYLLNFLPKSTAAEQLGTLGGGNHFLEVVYDEEGQVWAMLHSGSRNVGNQAASHHDKVAQEKGFADPGGLNHMRIDSQEGQAYLQVLCLTPPVLLAVLTP